MMKTAAELGAPPLTSHEDLRQAYRRHAVLAQYRRWYQLYENPAVSLDNQLDILAEDIALSSGLGEANGHAEYRARVATIPAEWKNAHFVNDADVTLLADGRAELVADITYLNQGALPDGAVRSADLTYTGTLDTPDGALLPVFETLVIEGESEGTAEAFRDAYAENRMRSLAHYWLALIEDPSRDPEPVREILADDFTLNFSSGAITDFDGFKAWLAGPGSAVQASTHRIGDFTVTESGGNAYRVQMTLDWQGLSPDGADLVARTRHDWQVVDDPAERFARIKAVDVEVLLPFQPVSG